MNSDSIIQEEFGIMFIPLDTRYKLFPIACIPATSCKAYQEIVIIIESITLQLSKNVKIIGLWTDEDNYYNSYFNIFFDSINCNFKNFLKLNAVEIITKYITLLHFSDPFHLTKRDRYKKVSSEEFSILLYGKIL